MTNIPVTAIILMDPSDFPNSESDASEVEDVSGFGLVSLDYPEVGDDTDDTDDTDTDDAA
jgi:hypothetical protein